MPKKLYLIPSLLSEEAADTLSPQIAAVLGKVKCFFVENERSARRFIKKVCPAQDVSNLTLFELSEHTDLKEAKEFFLSIDDDVGIISEAGCPCVADPGSDIVALAHQHNVEVVPLVGPSSILLALMASGLNGQNFAFVGYLPKEEGERRKYIKFLEKRSALENQTQIFIETPYRQAKVFEEILEACQPSTLLCLAKDITGREQLIRTQSIAQWAKKKPDVQKIPTIFLLTAKRSV